MNVAPLNSLVNHLFPGTGIRTIERLTGGVSAEVYRLGLTLIDGGIKSLVLRLHGASHSGHSADLEYKLLQSLHRSGLPVPEPLLVDVSGSRLQDPFLIMVFIEGETAIPSGQEDHYIDVMAEVLARIHDSPTADLPTLPLRIDPLPEVFDYLPEDREWEELRVYLRSLDNTAYMESPGLLHGDFWPENLLWQDGSIAAVLDWEDAALGDPLSDVACCRVELRYRFGKKGMQRFTTAYGQYHDIDLERLALWQVYVAAAAQRFMGDWGLDASLEAHMRAEALNSIRDAGAVLMGASRQGRGVSPLYQTL